MHAWLQARESLCIQDVGSIPAGSSQVMSLSKRDGEENGKTEMRKRFMLVQDDDWFIWQVQEDVTSYGESVFN